MNILQRIKDLLNAKNMTVYELSKKCGIARNTIYRWFNKNYTPTLDTLQVVCEKGFEISMSEFFASKYNTIALSPEIAELIETWTVLSSEQKQAINNVMLCFINQK